MQQLENERKKLSWGIPMHELPIISLEKYSEYVNDGRSLILIDGIAHDIRSFMNKHPGGSSILDRNTGKDCTGMFHGEVYAHSNAAINLLSTMRIARVEDISTPSRRIKPRKLIASDHDTMRGSHSSHAF
jgi:stearoyl-CoA desaturase (delta-9 desaturase)